MVIDCHCRAGNASLTPYLRRADHAGIDRTVLFASFKSDHAAANADVARFVSIRPDRFIGFCSSIPRGIADGFATSSARPCRPTAFAGSRSTGTTRR